MKQMLATSSSEGAIIIRLLVVSSYFGQLMVQGCCMLLRAGCRCVVHQGHTAGLLLLQIHSDKAAAWRKPSHVCWPAHL